MRIPASSQKTRLRRNIIPSTIPNIEAYGIPDTIMTHNKAAMPSTTAEQV